MPSAVMLALHSMLGGPKESRKTLLDKDGRMELQLGNVLVQLWEILIDGAEIRMHDDNYHNHYHQCNRTKLIQCMSVQNRRAKQMKT